MLAGVDGDGATEVVACAAPVRTMLTSLADMLWGPNKETMAQHVASIREAFPMVAGAAAVLRR